MLSLPGTPIPCELVPFTLFSLFFANEASVGTSSPLLHNGCSSSSLVVNAIGLASSKRIYEPRMLVMELSNNCTEILYRHKLVRRLNHNQTP